MGEQPAPFWPAKFLDPYPDERRGDGEDPDLTERYRAWAVRRVLQGFVLLLLFFALVIGADTLIGSWDAPQTLARGASAP